jgi:hypothetical protein
MRALPTVSRPASRLSEDLKADEFPAILQTGETVLSRTQVKEIRTEISKAGKSAAQGASESRLAQALAPIFHDGGVVGKMAPSTRLVPSAIFHNAPRFHEGMPSRKWTMPQTSESRTNVREIRQRGDMMPYTSGEMKGETRKERGVVININGVTDFNSFKRNEQQVQAAIARSTSRASRKNN